MKTNGTVLRTICLIFFLLASFIAVSGSNCLAKGLPSNFVAIFLPSTPSKGVDEFIYVDSIIALAKSYNIDVINLIVGWNDLEPKENALQLENLHALIAAIQNQGCYVILRIYANASDNHQAWPEWLRQQMQETYVLGGITNPLPWNAEYKNAFHSFLVRFNNWFVQKNQAFPDAIQITAGGSYGEQVLHGYDNPEYFIQYGKLWPAFHDALYEAEKEHVDFFAQGLIGIDADLSLMVNSLQPNDLTRNTSVGNYAKEQGVRWMQANAGICSLTYSEDGPQNLQLLSDLNSPLILEDEKSGAGACSQEDKPISKRLELIEAAEKDYGIKFNGIVLNVKDLSESNRQGIEQMLLRGANVQPETSTFVSTPTYDGWILESGEATGIGGSINSANASIVLGDNAINRQFRSILHFNTATLPDDAVITKAKISLVRQGIAGVNPLTTHRRILIDVKRGPFSGNSALQVTDFRAAANANNVGFLSYDPAAKAHTSELSAPALPFINRQGVTQFRLRFNLDDDNDYTADKIMFHSGNSPIDLSRPVLTVEYTRP